MADNNRHQDILKDLEAINSNLENKILQDPKIMQTVATSTKAVTFTDFRNLLNETNTSVRPIIEAFCESYVLPENMNDNRVQQRINIDAIALSEILWKKAIRDVAVIMLMEKIESGDDDFKMFGALSSLLQSNDNLPKELLQTIMVLEKNYKELKSEFFEQQKIPVGDLDGVNPDSMKFRGTKNLLMAIQNAKDLDKSKREFAAQEALDDETEPPIDIIRQKAADLGSENPTIL